MAPSTPAPATPLRRALAARPPARRLPLLLAAAVAIACCLCSAAAARQTVVLLARRDTTLLEPAADGGVSATLPLAAGRDAAAGDARRRGLLAFDVAAAVPEGARVLAASVRLQRDVKASSPGGNGGCVALCGVSPPVHISPFPA